MAEREKKPTAAKKPVARAPADRKAVKATARAAKAAPAKRAVARTATRAVVRRVAVSKPAPGEGAAAPRRRERPPGRPLPTAPAGHAPVIGADGSAAGTLALPEALAVARRRVGVLFQAFTATRANARQATAATKNRSRVSGGGAKPWRQKGTGRARAGSIRAPQWRHGAVAFGPNRRRYAQRIPAKMRRAAFAEAFAARAAEGRVLVYDALPAGEEGGRTRTMVDWLARIGDTGRALLVASELDEGLGRSVANIRDVELATPGGVRLADLLRSDTVLVARPALPALAARAGGGAPRGAGGATSGDTVMSGGEG